MFGKETPLRPIACVSAVVVLLAAGPLAADPIALTPTQQQLAHEAQNWLDGLVTAQGRFVQTYRSGEQAPGSFWIQRPGKARFAYDPPAALQIAADGRTVTEYDPRLKTVHAYPERSTPLALLLASHVALDDGAHVAAVGQTPEGFSVVVSAGPRRGSIALDFARAPLSLVGWTVTDPRGSSVHVRITQLERSAPKPSAFFVLKPGPKPGAPAP